MFFKILSTFTLCNFTLCFFKTLYVLRQKKSLQVSVHLCSVRGNLQLTLALECSKVRFEFPANIRSIHS